MEPVLARELEALGAQRIELVERAVYCVGDNELVYKANIWLRTALRILKPIYSFRVKDERQLYTALQTVPWLKYMSGKDTFAFDTAVHSPYFNHSQYVALKAKDSVADWFRNKLGYRPSVDIANPRVRFNIHIQGDEMTLSLDTSGNSLHRRGYRRDQNEAPLNEVLAAGLIGLSGWTGETPFMDLMCGSGTLPIEAAMIACNIAPNLHRTDFGFTHWKDYDPKLFKKVTDEAKKAVRESPVAILGSDISQRNNYIALENLKRTGLHGSVTFSVSPLQKTSPSTTPGTIILNPPYGERLQPDEIERLYADMGDTLKQRYSGWEAWILSSNLEAFKHVGLQASKKIALLNGKIDVQFRQYRMY